MNIGQYLVTLSIYACIGILILMVAAQVRGWRGLFGALTAVVLASALAFFTMQRPGGSGTPLAETIIAVVAAVVVAMIVWLRRSLTGFHRVKTLIVSLLAFHVAWLGVGFALKDWHY
jgi:hypothetical protein